MDTEETGVETLQDEYTVDACFCKGDSNFECYNPSTTLEQNSGVDICLTPTSTDTDIYQFTLDVNQEDNACPLLPVLSVRNDVNGVAYTYPLTVITQSGDTKKFNSMVFCLFFDQLYHSDLTILPDIKFNGTVYLNFQTVSDRRLIENALIVWTVPSSGLSRSQEGNIFDQDPTNTSTADNGVAAQAKFGLSAQIKRDTNKEGG